jgi:hypothetical protein
MKISFGEFEISSNDLIGRLIGSLISSFWDNFGFL